MLGVLGLFSIQGNYGQQYEVRALENFQHLAIGKQISVTIAKGIANKIEIFPSYKIWNEDIITRVEKKTLKIQTKSNFADTMVNCRVELTDSISSLSAINGGVISTDSGYTIQMNKLDIGAGLAAEMNVRVDVNILQINAADGSIINISGNANKVIINATTGSKLHLNNLTCNDATVKSSLGAKVWITANINFWANATSGGKIYYAKPPVLKFEKKRSTGGNVELIPQ